MKKLGKRQKIDNMVNRVKLWAAENTAKDARAFPQEINGKVVVIVQEWSSEARAWMNVREFEVRL